MTSERQPNPAARRHASLENAFSPPSRGERLTGTLEPKANQSEAQERVPRPADRPTGAPRNITVYLGADTADALRRRRRDTRSTYANLLADALDEVDISTLFTPPRKDGMPRTPTPGPGDGMQVQFRMTPAQVQYVEEKREEANAPSRSAFINAVLRQHLHA